MLFMQQLQPNSGQSFLYTTRLHYNRILPIANILGRITVHCNDIREFSQMLPLVSETPGWPRSRVAARIVSSAHPASFIYMNSIQALAISIPGASVP